MKIFLDTADIDEVREAASLGVLDGVTTNPTHLSKVEGTFEEIIEEICEVVDGPISAECVASDALDLISEARRLSSIHPNVAVKIPITLEGLKAIKVCSEEGIRINTTLIFSANQALLAAKAGAAFVSPFIGRLDDTGQDGLDIIEQTVEIFDIHDIKAEVLAASLRSPRHVIEVARAGAHIATLPPAVLWSMVKHPLTDIGIERFLADWRKVEARGGAGVLASG
jgi:transaldolase